MIVSANGLLNSKRQRIHANIIVINLQLYGTTPYKVSVKITSLHKINAAVKTPKRNFLFQTI